MFPPHGVVWSACMPSLFIDEFVGISNRRETLPLAFAIQKAFGHSITLDWHELDSFAVAGTQRGRVGLRARVGAVRVRECERALFDTLAKRKIILRSLDGPGELLDPIYLETARRLQLSPELATAIRRTFEAVKGRPVVGVHVRRGDYYLQDPECYLTEWVWPAVPEWWYALTMQAIRRANPDVVFFLASSGDPKTLGNLYDGLEIITLDAASPYAYKHDDHASAVHPVADLFALACCPVMLATPLSGYSHWAANALGEPTDCIVPLSGATRANPSSGLVQIYGSRLPRWREAGRTGANTVPLDANLSAVDFSRSANTDWLPVWPA